MFGDHQPSDYVTNVIDRATHYDPNSPDLEEAQKSFIVPYVVWSNTALEMESQELTSLNYLAADILQGLHMPLTDYQYFLLQLQKQIPVICAGAYVDTSGQYHSFDEDDETNGEMLGTYHKLQYNHMTDIAHRVWSIYTLQDKQSQGKESYEEDTVYHTETGQGDQ